MKIHVVTLMPELVRAALSSGVIGQAMNEGRWELSLVNPREFTRDVHHTVDDRVFGGSDGMLMQAEPLANSVEKIRSENPDVTVIHLSPRGRRFTDTMAREMAENIQKHKTSYAFIASRYAGVDERFIEEFCDDEISVGDFVVSGGDLPAALVIDAVLRHVPGVLGNQASAENDSFSEGIFESRQYTRPREWRGREVPAVLLSGDPALVNDWQFLEALGTTMSRRPDLVESLSEARLEEIASTLSQILQRLDREQRMAKPARAAAVDEISRQWEVARELASEMKTSSKIKWPSKPVGKERK